MQVNIEIADDYQSPLSNVLFSPAYYIEHNKLALSVDDALTHFLTEGFSLGFNPSPLVDTRYFIFASSDRGIEITTPHDFFAELKALTRWAEYGWSALFIPAWLSFQIPRASPDNSESLFDLLSGDTTDAAISIHPALLPIAPSHNHKTIADFIIDLTDEQIEAASIIDINQFVLSHRDFKEKKLTPKAAFCEAWGIGLSLNRFKYLDQKSPRRFSLSDKLRNALVYLYRPQINARLVEKDMPLKAVPDLQIETLANNFTLARAFTSYDVASDSPPPLQAFYKLFDIWTSRRLLVVSRSEVSRQALASPTHERKRNIKDTDLLSQRRHKLKRVVYSINLGLYDDEPIPPEMNDCEYFLITDAQKLRSNSPWQIVRPTLAERDLKRLCLWYKTHPHMLFNGVDHVTWIDGNIIAAPGAGKLLEAHETFSEIATFQHPDRSCVYEEATSIVALGLDQQEVIEKHVGRLRDCGVPEKFGLYETNVLYSKPMDYAVAQFFENWWREIFLGSRRDQMSFTLAAHLSAGIVVNSLDGKKCAKNSKYFSKRKHVRPVGRSL